MTDEAWNAPDVRVLGLRLNGNAIDEVDERGQRITGDTLLLMLNAGEQTVPFVLPTTAPAERWETLLDTCDPWAPTRRLPAGHHYELQSRSMAVLRLSGRREERRANHWGLIGVY
jgi:isoamylase